MRSRNVNGSTRTSTGPTIRGGPGGPRRRCSCVEATHIVTAVGVCGAIGTVARYGLEAAFPSALDGFPVVTLGVNLGGSLLLGVVWYIVFERRPPSPLLRPLLAIGLVGGFTTFSSLMDEATRLAQEGAYRQAACTLSMNMGHGVLAAAAGLR